uniref:Gemin6 6 n=1 Tax=Siphoviridae sp. cttDR14 TaxID=2826490 RepID=A0A8S5M2J1_9CAUD|nr:MAG TPA: Gemin6 6 [Siphoviridae sp. cttDR14]
MKYTHESEELNALLGKKVKVTLWNDKILTGVLTRAEYRSNRYEIANYSFRKTHVKKIEVVR